MATSIIILTIFQVHVIFLVFDGQVQIFLQEILYRLSNNQNVIDIIKRLKNISNRTVIQISVIPAQSI